MENTTMFGGSLWIWVIFIGFTVISWLISHQLKSRFQKYSKIPTANGMTGRDVVEKMLRDNGVTGVKIGSVEGMLTDHYNPVNKTINLSRDVYYGNSIAAAAVAAHETGHALQHAKGYSMLKLRSTLVPAVEFASHWVQWILLAGILMVNSFPGLLLVGIGLFAIMTLFSFVTLPVEIDASHRALAWLRNSGITDYQTQGYAFDALKWAAYTYVIAALSSLATSVKYGGVVEALALATFGNHIGATVTLENLETALTAQLGGFVFTSPEEISGVGKIGQTAADFTLTVNGVTLDGHKLDSAFQGKLEEVYPTEFAQATELEEVPAVTSDAVIKAKETVETPVVYIPVFPGTNSEYDSAKAFEKEGAKVNLVPFVTLNEEAIVKSVDIMVDNVEKANIIFFAGGFSAADEPDGSAKFIVNILLNEKVRAAIDSFIERGGLIIGICNGFQALVKSGLLPYGNFEDASSTSPTLFYNDANQHVAKMVETRIANTNSPWLAGVEVGDIHAIPVSHGEGKFVVTAEEFAELRDNGQIFTQYVDFEGKPSMDSKYNPNGSVNAIEGITSKNGQIIGKMGHSERFEDGLFQNIPGNKDQHLFASAVKYFTGK